MGTLQAVCRPNDITPALFDAISLRTYYDADPVDIIPDSSNTPDFACWRQLSIDEARERNESTRKPLSNGNKSPGCQVYCERRKELSIPNEDAFHTVRRLPPKKGKQPPRLGNSYEFFRCLELMTPYWDDTAATPKSAENAAPEAPAEGEAPVDNKETDDSDSFNRTMAGTATPAEHRHSLLTAFIKLVAYDFGCNVSTPRTEPRLHLCAPSTPGRSARKSYVPSGCIFVFRTPTKREEARGGFVEGPVAAVSARATTAFDIPLEKNQDLAREVLAALVTAQHRAREGKTEKRFGEGEWWTTKPRWGGGPGGPIGREIDGDDVVGDKDAASPPSKKPRKTIAAYDNYRMLKPPSLSWDRKTKYQAIGRVPGAAFDDVFVISSLYHHVSIIRVRVPKRLLEVLDGEEDGNRGELLLWRSKWYDFFVTEDRIEAMELLWGVFAYQMRAEGPKEGN